MKGKFLYYFIAAFVLIIQPTIAVEITVDGTVTMGSSMGLISNGSEDYSYARTTKNIVVLSKACPLSMGTETRCIVKFDAQNGSITKIISARRPPSSAQTNPQITQAPERSTPSRRPEWKDAFSRRNYQLGMSLSEFRSVPYPDQKEWPGAYPICSNEISRLAALKGSEGSGLSSFAFKDIGVIKCEFFYPSESSMFGTISAGLLLADMGSSYNEFFFMRPKIGSEPVLYEISSQFPSANFSLVVNSIQNYYGSPEKAYTVNMTTGIGIQLSGNVVRFANSSGYITIKQYSSDIRRGSISYILNDVANEVAAKSEKINKRVGPP